MPPKEPFSNPHGHKVTQNIFLLPFIHYTSHRMLGGWIRKARAQMPSTRDSMTSCETPRRVQRQDSAVSVPQPLTNAGWSSQQFCGIGRLGDFSHDGDCGPYQGYSGCHRYSCPWAVHLGRSFAVALRFAATLTPTLTRGATAHGGLPVGRVRPGSDQGQHRAQFSTSYPARRHDVLRRSQRSSQ